VGMSTTPPFVVTCYSCKSSFDALTAGFCSCLSSERTLLCPSCLNCSCSAPPDFKRRLWTGAPPELWNRKFAEHNRVPEEPSNPAPEEAKRPLVLLVDDEADIRRVATRAIQALGYGLITARNGQEGLELARQYRPDLVLSDALMPKLDGRDMCRQIKEDRELLGTKVVVMTSLYKGVKYENQAHKAYRVDDYLVKPLDFARLRALLDKHLPPPSGEPGGATA
jgi:CheY-like chemotaxis protein